MRCENIGNFVILLALVLIAASCDSDRRCAYDLTGQIAEHSAVFDFFPVEGDVRILTADEKRNLLSRITLPSCANGVRDLESKYEIATTKAEIIVWPTTERRPERLNQNRGENRK